MSFALRLPLVVERASERANHDSPSRSIFTFPKLGTKVQQTSIPLSYTPRKLLTSPTHKLLYTIESDHRTLSPSAQAKLLADQRAAGMDVDEEVAELPADVFGLPRAGAGNWASCVRIIDPVEVSFSFARSFACSAREANHSRASTSQATTIFKLDFDNNEAAFSVALVNFHGTKDEQHLVVGTGQDTTLAPRTCKSGFLTTYKVLEDGRSLELLHKVSTRVLLDEREPTPSSFADRDGRRPNGPSRFPRTPRRWCRKSTSDLRSRKEEAVAQG